MKIHHFINIEKLLEVENLDKFINNTSFYSPSARGSKCPTREENIT